MKKNLKGFAITILTLISISCSSKIEQPINEELPNTSSELKAVSSAYTVNNYYSPPSSNTPKVTFTGKTSSQLNTFINTKSNNGGAIISIPKGTYKWTDIRLKSNIHLEIESGTVIKPATNTTRRIFNLGDNSRIMNISISGKGGKFIVDISDDAFTNNKIVAIKIGRVNNFKLHNFEIKDRRSAVASITLSYIGNTSERRPSANNGVIQNIKQSNAHTGYGLIQCYSGNNVLFKNLTCEGGVTLRLETDDRIMKDEVKNGDKEGGVKNIFAYNIKCTNGITPLMFSPHFAQNGKVTAEKITATGCAFAVRVEHGFVELFDVNTKYPTNISNNGTKFKNYIESQFNLSSGVRATSGNAYKRNNGAQWAIRLSAAGINAPRNNYVKSQLGILKAGKFTSSNISNVIANYKKSGAKIKQAYLKYLPCSEWAKVKNPTTSLGMSNGFEYHGPSLSLSIDNTNGTSKDGNYIIRLSDQHYNGFPNTHVQNIKHNTTSKCNSSPNNIATYSAFYD